MKVLAVLYDGFVEFEHVIPLMALHYYGIESEIVGLDKTEITGITGLKALVSKRLDEVGPLNYDALLLPGVAREKHQQVLENETLLQVIRELDRAGKLIAAICMAPAFLGAAGVLRGRHFSSTRSEHPAFAGAIWEDQPAVRDSHIITGKGERVFHFTALFLEALIGKERADEYRHWAGIPESQSQKAKEIAYFIDLSRSPKIIQMEGLETTILTGLSGEKMMMVLNATLPGHTVPTHSHPHEQVGMVYSGKARLKVGDEERTVERGDFYCIPAGVPHSDTCLGDEPFVMLDIFYPIREDLITKLSQLSSRDKNNLF